MDGREKRGERWRKSDTDGSKKERKNMRERGGGHNKTKEGKRKDQGGRKEGRIGYAVLEEEKHGRR